MRLVVTHLESAAEQAELWLIQEVQERLNASTFNHAVQRHQIPLNSIESRLIPAMMEIDLENPCHGDRCDGLNRDPTWSIADVGIKAHDRISVVIYNILGLYSVWFTVWNHKRLAATFGFVVVTSVLQPLATYDFRLNGT